MAVISRSAAVAVAIGMVILVSLIIVAMALPSAISESSEDTSSTPMISTEGGMLAGMVESSTRGKLFHSYYSIPFALPPVGDLRFQLPVEGVQWNGVRDATTPPPPCPQLPSTLDHSFLYGEEDCLYLNVFTSKINSTITALPVLVYIHGGAFFLGRAHRHQPYALLNEDVVYVALQYRLGVLGFLSTDDEVLPGNLGLWDQLSALRWVSRNIAQFGGDPGRITIFGQSSGAACVHLLVLSPKSEGLFHRAIIQSGSALGSWSMGIRFKETAVKVAKLVGCGDKLNSSVTLVECLKSVKSEELVTVIPKIMSKFYIPLFLAPRVDGEVVPDFPEVLAASGKHMKVDIISGYTSHDGAESFISKNMTSTDLSDNFEEFGPKSLDYRTEDDNPVRIARLVYEFYMGGRRMEPADNYVQMMTDRGVGIPEALAATLHARQFANTTLNTRTYRYVFNHRGQRSVLDNFNVTGNKHWVSHSDDMFYLFPGAPDWATLTYPADLAVRDIMTKLWSNFAATGDPTPDESLGFKWEPISEGQHNFLSILPSPVMMEETDSRRQARVFMMSLPTRQNYLINENKIPRRNSSIYLKN